MLAQLKRSFPDLYHHKTHQPLHNKYSQSTPQTFKGRAAIRRQSSVGPLNDTSPLTGGAAPAEPAISTPAHSATLPVSSLSTNPSSYYTNASPSPPAPSAPVHVSCDDILTPTTQHIARTSSSRSAPHSATNLHQAGRPTALTFSNERSQNPGSIQDSVSPQYQNVGTASSMTMIITKLDELSRRVAVLESGLTMDVRRILQLLQTQRDPVPPHHNSQPVHTPSQPLQKASLSVPQPNENQWEWNWNSDRERSVGRYGRSERSERTPAVQRSASEPHEPLPPTLPPPPHSHSFYR